MARKGLASAIDRAHDLLDRGDAAPARALLERALAEGRSSARAIEVASALGLVAVARRDEGELAEARAAFADARAALAEPGSDAERATLAAILEDEAELELELQAPDTARARLRASIALREAIDDAIEAETWLALAEAELRAGAPREALAAIDRALAAEGEDEDHALAEELRGDALLEEPEAARGAYERALARWSVIDDREAQARVIVALARLDEQRDDRAALAARRAAIAALAIDVALRDEALAEIDELIAGLG